MAISRPPAAHGYQAAGMLIDPAAAVWRYLEGRRDVKQVPGAAQFDKEAKAMAAEKSQITVGG